MPCRRRCCAPGAAAIASMPGPDVIDVRDGLIAQVTTFDAALFDAFGLPRTLSAG